MTDEVSYVEDPLDSDCSSLASSEEQNHPDQLVEPHDNVAKLEGKYLSALSFSSSISMYNSLHTPSKVEAPCAVETERETCEKKDPTSYFQHHQNNGPNFNRSSLHLELEELNLSHLSETQDPENEHDMCLPQGGLLKSPICVGRGNIDDTWSHFCCSGLEVSNRKISVLDNNTSISGDMMLSRIDSEGSTADDQHPSGPYALSSSFSSQSWKVKYDSKFLSANPILAKHSFRCTYMHGERHSTEYREHLSSFDFTSVKDPFKVSMENLSASPRHRFGTELSALTDSALAAGFGTSDFHDKKGHNGNAVSLNNTKSSHVFPPLGSMADSRENVLLKNVSGGSGWQSLLGSSYNSDDIAARDHKTSLTGKLEIPLDFVIEKCLLEEILLQYPYFGAIYNSIIYITAVSGAGFTFFNLCCVI